MYDELFADVISDYIPLFKTGKRFTTTIINIDLGGNTINESDGNCKTH